MIKRHMIKRHMTCHDILTEKCHGFQLYRLSVILNLTSNDRLNEPLLANHGKLNQIFFQNFNFPDGDSDRFLENSSNFCFEISNFRS